MVTAEYCKELAKQAQIKQLNIELKKELSIIQKQAKLGLYSVELLFSDGLIEKLRILGFVVSEMYTKGSNYTKHIKVSY